MTTGGSTVQAIEAVRAEGFDVCGVVSVLDRLAGGAEAIRAGVGRRAVRAAGHDRRHLPRPPDALTLPPHWAIGCSEALDLSTLEFALCALAAIAGAVDPGRGRVRLRARGRPDAAAGGAGGGARDAARRRDADGDRAGGRGAAGARRGGVRAADRRPDPGHGARRVGAHASSGRRSWPRRPGRCCCCAVAASVFRGARSTSPRLEVAAGFASGVAGTVGAVGGPYLGLAYADRPGPVLRATISLAFAVGVVLSLAAVGIAGRDRAPAPLRLGAALVPSTFLGLWLGRRLRGRARRRAAAARRARASRARRARSRSCAACSDAVRSVERSCSPCSACPGSAPLFAFRCIGRLPMGALGLLMILQTHERTGSFASGGLVAAELHDRAGRSPTRCWRAGRPRRPDARAPRRAPPSRPRR